MSFNIRKLNNIVQKNPIFLKTQNLSKIKKVFYSYIGICTIGGFTYGCKSSLDDIKSYNNAFTDKFEKITLNLIVGAIYDIAPIIILNLTVGTIYGIGVGLYAPFTIPTYAIIAYKDIKK